LEIYSQIEQKVSFRTANFETSSLSGLVVYDCEPYVSI